jgi:hypothetical protein
MNSDPLAMLSYDFKNGTERKNEVKETNLLKIALSVSFEYVNANLNQTAHSIKSAHQLL